MSIKTVPVDAFLASLQAAESMRGCRAVLHGPGGCRGYPSRTSAQSVTRDFDIREGPFFFLQPRVPCTYLDEEDYINGADYKMQDLLDEIGDAEVCVVVCSPGTSLIGDDLNGAACRSSFKGEVLVMAENLMSQPAHVGYDATVSAMVKRVCRKAAGRERRVNILGIPVFMEGWETAVEELSGYLEAMGFEAVAVGAGCTVDELRGSSASELCVSVLPEFCRRTAEAYGALGVPTLFAPVPVGFSATSEWIRSVAERLGASPEPALALAGRRSGRARNVLRSGMTNGLALKCATYSLDMECSAALPLMEWLYRYLGMFPREVCRKGWWDEGYEASVVSFLESIRCEEALVDSLSPVRCDVVFADGQVARLLERDGVCSVGIGVWPPYLHTMRFLDRPILGCEGALRILDRLFEEIERDRRRYCMTRPVDLAINRKSRHQRIGTLHQTRRQTPLQQSPRPARP